MLPSRLLLPLLLTATYVVWSVLYEALLGAPLFLHIYSHVTMVFYVPTPMHSASQDLRTYFGECNNSSYPKAALS